MCNTTNRWHTMHRGSGCAVCERQVWRSIKHWMHWKHKYKYVQILVTWATTVDAVHTGNFAGSSSGKSVFSLNPKTCGPSSNSSGLSKSLEKSVWIELLTVLTSCTNILLRKVSCELSSRDSLDNRAYVICDILTYSYSVNPKQTPVWAPCGAV